MALTKEEELAAQKLALKQFSTLVDKYGMELAAATISLIGSLGTIAALVVERTGDAKKGDEFLQDVAKLMIELGTHATEE